MKVTEVVPRNEAYEPDIPNSGSFQFGRERNSATVTLKVSESAARLFKYIQESGDDVESFYLDPKGRPHRTDGPAFTTHSGLKFYAVDGVEVPENAVEDPALLTTEEFNKYTNAETRRLIIELIGQTRFAEMLKLQLIDLKQINDQEYMLMETKEPDPVFRIKMKFVRVICHSTGRIYYIPVPPDMTDAHEAVAWTFYRTKETYKPIFEA